MSNAEIKITLSGAIHGTFFDNYHEIERQIVGKILTLADATFANADQCKAFKDIVSQTIKGVMQDALESAGELTDAIAEECGDGIAVDCGSDRSSRFTEHLHVQGYKYTRSEK